MKVTVRALIFMIHRLLALAYEIMLEHKKYEMMSRSSDKIK